MRRREFITLVGGAAAAWPLGARAQQPAPMRRVSLLLGIAENDPEARSRVKAFQQGLRDLGWLEGRNIRIDYRFSDGDPNRIKEHVAELVKLCAGRDRRKQHAGDRRSAAGDKHHSDRIRGGQ